MTQRFYFSGFLLMAAILSGAWVLWQYVIDFSWEKPGNLHNPDTFVNNLQIISMNTEGKRAYQFSAAHVLHYADNDRTSFTLPYLIFYEKNMPPWLIQSGYGEAIHGNAKLKLWQNVTMTQSQGVNNPSALIKTQAIWIYPKQRIAETEKYIIATQANAQIESTGMKLDMTHKTIDLLKQVQGMYAPAN